VGTKVSEAGFALLEERARANGLTLSAWVRDVLLSAPGEQGRRWMAIRTQSTEPFHC